MPSLYITPVYKGPECHVGRGLRYISGLYEVSEVLGAGPYTSFIDENLVSGRIEHLVEAQFPDLLKLGIRDVAHGVSVCARQLEDFDSLLHMRALKGRFTGSEFLSLYEGTKRTKRGFQDALVKYKPQPVEFKHQLFRAYGIRYGNDVLLITGMCMKTTRHMNASHRVFAEHALAVLDAAENIWPGCFNTQKHRIDYETED